MEFVDSAEIISTKELSEALKISEISARRHIKFLAKTGVLEQIIVCKNCHHVMRSWEDRCPVCDSDRRNTMLAYRKRRKLAMEK